MAFHEVVERMEIIRDTVGWGGVWIHPGCDCLGWPNGIHPGCDSFG